MSAQTVKIIQKGQYEAEILVNGVDFAPMVSGYGFGADFEDGPRLMLVFSPSVLPEFDGPAEVSISEDLHQALVHLGWTPPSAGISGLEAPDAAQG